MAFQPFGYPFRIEAPMQPEAAKLAIRAKWKRWFDMKPGARGWIVGPFICLWASAFDRQGPMLLGRITASDRGTTIISGRAGSNLNGVAYLALFCVLGIWAALAMSNIWLLALFGGMAALVFWFAHKDRRQAEPLIRFLDSAVVPSPKKARRMQKDVAIPSPLRLIIDGGEVAGLVTPERIYDALVELTEDSFVILAFADERYIQTLSKSGGYVVEKREGDRSRHFEGRMAGIRSDRELPPNRLSFDEIFDTFLAYAAQTPGPAALEWRRMDV